jgi:hypothetical protein
MVVAVSFIVGVPLIMSMSRSGLLDDERTKKE